MTKADFEANYPKVYPEEAPMTNYVFSCLVSETRYRIDWRRLKWWHPFKTAVLADVPGVKRAVIPDLAQTEGDLLAAWSNNGWSDPAARLFMKALGPGASNLQLEGQISVSAYIETTQRNPDGE
jgi:hypothetical protein